MTQARAGVGQLSILAAALFLVGSAEVVTGPLMTAMAPDFGVPPASIAYLPAAYGLAYGGFAIIAGPLSDRVGRKRPLQAGLLGFALLGAALPSAPDLSTAIALSALAGLCGAFVQPNSLSFVADSSSPQEVDIRTARVFVGLMSAFVVTPSIAGWVADQFGWRSAYYLLSLASALVFLAVSAGFRAGRSHGGGIVSFVATHRGALATPGVVRRLAASYFWLGSVAGFGVVVADVAARKLSLSPTDAGLLAGFFGLVTIAGNLAGPTARGLLAHKRCRSPVSPPRSASSPSRSRPARRCSSPSSGFPGPSAMAAAGRSIMRGSAECPPNFAARSIPITRAC